MSEPKWMSAKWRIGEYQKVVDETNAIVRVSGVSLPCGNVPSDDESYEHGALLAASPRLYRALDAILTEVRTILQSGPRRDLLIEANEAMAQARGEL